MGKPLRPCPTGREDFAVACQFIEHCQHPVRALVNMLRVVKNARAGIGIHWHAWDPEAFLGFLLFFKERFRMPFRIFATMLNGNELMVALQKRVG